MARLRARGSRQRLRSALARGDVSVATRIDGFVDASILTRPAGNGVEFLIVTRWHSMEAIRQFAGTDVAHYEVLEP